MATYRQSMHAHLAGDGADSSDDEPGQANGARRRATLVGEGGAAVRPMLADAPSVLYAESPTPESRALPQSSSPATEGGDSVEWAAPSPGGPARAGGPGTGAGVVRELEAELEALRASSRATEASLRAQLAAEVRRRIEAEAALSQMQLRARGARVSGADGHSGMSQMQLRARAAAAAAADDDDEAFSRERESIAPMAYRGRGGGHDDDDDDDGMRVRDSVFGPPSAGTRRRAKSAGGLGASRAIMGSPLQFLKTVSLFKTLSEVQLAKVNNQCDVKHYGAGEAIVYVERTLRPLLLLLLLLLPTAPAAVPGGCYAPCTALLLLLLLLIN